MRRAAAWLAAVLASCGGPAPQLATVVPAGCAAPPAPVRDLLVEPFYMDAAYSIPDPAKVAAERDASQPLQDFLRRVQPPTAPACALAAFDAWARGDALLGQFSSQGAYRREWTLAGAAVSYLRLKAQPGLDSAAKARVEAWLQRVAGAVRPHYDRVPGPGITDLRNNHSYWAGLAVGAVGAATGDRAMLDWGMGRARMGLRDVTAEGALPLELARRGQALHYHLFALEPLAALAYLGAVNGVPLDDAETAALDRLVHFTVAAAQDPAQITALAGAAPVNIWSSRPELTGAGGVAIWLAMHEDAGVAAAIAPYRPFRDLWLGGTVSDVWPPLAR